MTCRIGNHRRADAVRRLFLLLVVASISLIGCTAYATGGGFAQEPAPDNPGIDRPVDLPLIELGDRIDPMAYSYYVDAVIYEAQGNAYQATESYRKALRFYPESYEIRFSLSENLYRMQRFDDALMALGPIKPADADVWELRGDIYRGSGQIDSAVHAYRRAVEHDSSRFELYSFLASSYARDGELQDALWAFENLARLDPENYAVWYEIGRIHLHLGHVDQAEAAFGRSASLRSDAFNVMSLIGLGEILESREKFDSALTVYQRVVAVDSANIVAHRNLAAVYVRLDSLGRAAEHARLETRFSPLDRQASRRLGMLYFFLDSLSAADSVFTALVNGGERHPANHQYLGRIALRQDQPDRAVNEFQQVLALSDSSWESWAELGAAYRAAENRTKEIEAYRTGLSQTQGDRDGAHRLMMALGSAYEQSGKFDSALAVFEDLVAQAPEYDMALNYLGYMLADSGQRLDYARELIERALKISPENAAYLDSYAWVHYRLGNFNEAREYMERAVALDSDPTMFDHLGDIYQALGNTEEARRWWQKALELDPDNMAVKTKLGR